MKQLSTEAIKMLEMRVGKSTVQSWFNSLMVNNQDESVTVLFPSHFVQSWIRNNYGELFDSIIRAAYNVENVSFAISQDPVNQIEPISECSMPINQKMLLSNFVIGDSNKSVYMAAERVGKDNMCNLLFIHADSGHGKSHLLHSIGNRFMTQGKKVCYLSAEQYMLLFIKSIRDKETIKFKNMLREVELLLIDDFQFIQGKETTQEEFFYNLSFLLNQQGCIVIAADRPPSELRIDSRVKARISGGLVLNIDRPSEDLKLKILEQKVKQYKKNISHDILELITQNIRGSVRELEGALLRICAQIEFFGEKVNISNARDILSDILTEKKPKSITSNLIVSKVQEFYDCDIYKSRERKAVKARQVCMYLCRKVKNMSLPTIASLMGAKDHTNVIYSIKQVESKLGTDETLAKEINLLRAKVEQGE